MKKFYAVIGNPPYQESRESTKDFPIYNDFMDEAFCVGERVELITPARFLFNAGATPKTWNKKMLSDEHFKVLDYDQKGAAYFPNVDIKGGVAITYKDDFKNYGAMEIFLVHPELRAILEHVKPAAIEASMAKIMYPYSTYTLSNQLWSDFPKLRQRVEYIAKNRKSISPGERKGELSNLRIITTNIFELLPDLFFETKPDDGKEYCCLLGRENSRRVYKYILSRYIDVGDNYLKYKVIIPASNGAGVLGEVLSTPLVGIPLVGYTQSFLGVGSFESEDEADSCMKYLKTKFARAMLGVLKITQHNPPEKWKYVPLQDFTSASDIDWSKSISEIDKQLYEKYCLSTEEINFIESHVREMK